VNEGCRIRANRYLRSALTVEECNGNSRSGLNFDRGTRRVPAASSKSPMVNRKASPSLIAVHAISPINVT